MTAERGAHTQRWSAACWRVLPALLWAALIFAVSAQPDLPHMPLSAVDLVVKKGAHMAAYAVLAILVGRALSRSRTELSTGGLLAAWALAVLYAISDEMHQSFVPGRTAAAADVLIDGAGAMLGLGGLALVRRQRVAARVDCAAPLNTKRA